MYGLLHFIKPDLLLKRTTDSRRNNIIFGEQKTDILELHLKNRYINESGEQTIHNVMKIVDFKAVMQVTSRIVTNLKESFLTFVRITIHSLEILLIEFGDFVAMGCTTDAFVKNIFIWKRTPSIVTSQ